MSDNRLFDANGDTKWILVKSSNLFAIKYNINNRILNIQFGNPNPVSQYAYKNISLSMFTALMQAPSHGGYFHKAIRKYPVDYPYTPVEMEDIDQFNSRWAPGQASSGNK